jgi:DNA polymerase (family 10)
LDEAPGGPRTDNDHIAAAFDEIADLLDLQGIAFKPVAYRRAARNIQSMEDDINKIAAEGKLEDIPGVGKAMAKKIDEMVKTGKLAYLDELRSQVPKGLVELLGIPDVGPKTAVILYKELGITSSAMLKNAVLNHKLRGIKGFGEKTEERILRGITTVESKAGRTLLGTALPVAEAFVEYLRQSQSLQKISVAGSLRRGKETVGDIDILVGDDEPGAIMDTFVAYGEVGDVLMKGPTKSSVRLKNGLQVDIRAVEAKSWGAALCYFTGSKEHNVSMRRIGVEMGLKLNEYGLFERDSGKLVTGATEEQVYKALGLRYVEPELRENSGELEASRENKLPRLLKKEELLGDFHVHTSWSDGVNKIEDVVSAAATKGYEYVAITDHSQSLRIANGLSSDSLKKQIEAVRKADELRDGEIRVLAGSEVDIKADGSLDFPSSLLKDLDIVVGSVHSRFKMEKADMTKRVTTALESGRIDILGHPTGRLIGQRPPYELDLGLVFSSAKSSGVCLELNSFPDRLDLSDVNCRLAKDAGVKVAIATDAHSVDQMAYIRYGLITARRGWLERDNVLNSVRGKDIIRQLHGGRR